MNMSRRGLFSLLGKIGLGVPAAAVLSKGEASAKRFEGVEPLDDDACYVSADSTYVYTSTGITPPMLGERKR